MITASIVFYNKTGNPVKINEVKRTIECVLNSSIERLFIIDNSPTDILLGEIDSSSPKITYIQGYGNVGFGKAHNLAIKKAEEEKSTYHFIINPDILFKPEVIDNMINYMENNSDVGMIMPQVLYPDGKMQYLPKLLPTPLKLIQRKLYYLPFFNKIVKRYELRAASHQTYNTPFLSGCFNLTRTDILTEIGGFDDNFFMYFEDVDISRRIHNKYKTMYYSDALVHHGYERGANKNFRLFKIYIQSAIRYFNKWGWFFDKERKKINKKTLNDLNYK